MGRMTTEPFLGHVHELDPFDVWAVVPGLGRGKLCLKLYPSNSFITNCNIYGVLIQISPWDGSSAGQILSKYKFGSGYQCVCV